MFQKNVIPENIGDVSDALFKRLTPDTAKHASMILTMT